jgi:hypothetical protein
MKFSAAILIASLVGAASAFSPVSLSSTRAATSLFDAGSPEPVDRSLKGIDSDASVFDPTSGENPALIRNNNDEVWVSQVGLRAVLEKEYELNRYVFSHVANPKICCREPALVVIASPPPCEQWFANAL